MSAITLPEFLRLVSPSQCNIFAYNQKLVEMIVDGRDRVFEGAVVLDAGAGARLNHFRHQVRVARCVVGVDLAYDDLRVNCDVDARVVGDVERLPFQSGAFGCILSVDVVEHLDNPAAFFREAARCLRPGGTLIVCTPNLLGYKNLIAYLLPRPLLDLAWRKLRGRPSQPYRTYYRSNTLRRIRRLGMAAGLTVEQANYLNEISHFFYPHWILCVLAYLYGRLLERLHLGILLNYMVCVLRKGQFVAL